MQFHNIYAFIYREKLLPNWKPESPIEINTLNWIKFSSTIFMHLFIGRNCYQIENLNPPIELNTLNWIKCSSTIFMHLFIGRRCHQIENLISCIKSDIKWCSCRRHFLKQVKKYSKNATPNYCLHVFRCGSISSICPQ